MALRTLKIVLNAIFLFNGEKGENINMPKQLNVSLRIDADVGSARAQIQSLVSELNTLGSSTNFKGLNLTPQLTEAKMAAAQLGEQLNSAFNVDTGKLDLNKFNDSLRRSGMSLSDYGTRLTMLGPQGQQAFSQVAQAVIQTEAPIRRSNALLKSLGTTMMNTAKWQISSSVLHGFISSIQKATGYAKDLDKSLNNIRIVTGYGVDEMARFAKQANKAAKELSTTTTKYTDASLIYYQQGLSTEEVEERTTVTIKMANAAGESAEKVSDQMTAVWNNFADGTKSLEYYADVMTALGAATASSTDEIAGGLEKFAAIGETIGLSYEYAASALATITSNTRQSEEVVGTALKTIFARIQGLKLGDTLEDGVDLNKYSEALQKVGIDILDASGEMKNMDTILDEMATKWQGLSKAQQAALAQTVAGIRQYTQLIALMENWNDGSTDSMMSNLSTAYGSAGTLDEQAKIYEESWQASSDRVKAALEGVYDSIFDESTFIGINDSLAGTIGLLEKIIDSSGGFVGLLSMAGMLITSVFRDEMAQGINNALHNFKNFTGASKAELETLKQKAYEYTKSLSGGMNTSQSAAENTYTERTYEMQKLLEQALIRTNAAQEQSIRETHQIAQNYAEAALNAQKLAAESEKSAQAMSKTTNKTKGSDLATDMQGMVDLANESAGEDVIKIAKEMEKKAMAAGGAGEEVSALKAARENYATASNNYYSLPEAEQVKGSEAWNQLQNAAQQLQSTMQALHDTVDANAQVFDRYQMELEEVGQKVGQTEISIASMQQTLKDSKTPITSDSIEGQEIQKSISTAQELDLPVSDASSALDEFNKIKTETPDAVDKIDAAWQKVIETFKNITITAEQAEEAMEKMAKQKTAEGLAVVDKEVDAAGTIANKAQDEADQAQWKVDDINSRKKSYKGSEKKNAEVAAEKAKAKADETSSKYEKLKSKHMEKTSKVLKQVTKGTEEYTKSIHKHAKDQASAVKIDEAAAKKKEELAKAMADAKKTTKDFGQGMTTVLSGTSQLSMGLFSLKSAFDTLKDPDMSTFDKFTSVLMSMSMGIPAFVTGIKSITVGCKEMIGSLGGSTTALLANALGLDAAALAESKLNRETLEGLEIKTTKKSLDIAEQLTMIQLAAAKTLESEAQEESNEEKAKDAGLTLTNIALRKMETMATSGGIAAKIAETAANWALNSSMTPMLALTLAITAALIAFVAIALAVAAAVNAIVAAHNADAEAAADAREQVELLTTHYEDCKAAAEELKTSISNWEGGIEALKKLDKSTDEYRQKLEEVNTQARELIETYGLYDDFEVKDGVIVFKEGALERAQNEYDQKANSAESQLYSAKILQNKADVKNEGTNLARKVGSAGQYTNATMENWVGYFDKIAASKSANLPEGEEFTLDVNMIREALTEGVEGMPDVLKETLSGLSDEDIQAVIDFRNSMNDATAANKYYAEQMLASMVKSKYSEVYKKSATDQNGVVDEGLYQSMLNAGTKFASTNVKNAKGQTWDQVVEGIDVSKATSNNSLNSNYGYSVKNDKDLAKQYAVKVLGWSESDFSYQSGTGKGTLTNASTGQEMTLDDNVMRQGLARQGQLGDAETEFTQYIEDQMNNFNSAMHNVVTGAKNDAVATTIIDAAGSGGEIDYSALINQISPEELLELNSDQKLTSDEVMTALGLNDADLKAMGLENGQDFVNGLSEALTNYSPTEFYKNMREAAATEAGAQAKEEGFNEEDTADIQEYAKYVMSAAKSSEILDDSLASNAEAAADVATYTAKMNRGIDTLADGFEEWNDVLKNSDKSSAEYSKALSGMKGALSDILGVEEDYISNDFVTEHMNDIKLAAEGNADAIDRLAIAAGKDILVNMHMEGGEEVREQVLGLHNELAAEIPDIKVGATVDDEEFMKKAAQIVEQAGMSVEQANAYFRSMGFEPTFETKTVDVTREVKALQTETEILEWGSAPGILGGLNQFPTKILESTTEVSNGTVTEKMEVPALSTDGGKPNFTLTRTNAGSMNNYSSSNKGGKSPGSGSGSKSEPKKADRKKESDVVERYKEIEDSLDDLRNTMEDVNKTTDRLYGASRIKQMERSNAMIQEEIKLLQKKKEEAKAYLALDKAKVDQAAKEAGVSFTYDENGNILNQTSTMNALLDQYNAAVDAANADGNADEDENKRLEELDEKITNLKDATSQYEETRELIEDLDDQIDDQFYAWQDNNAEILSYKLEIQIELNDDELRKMDYYLSKTEDDFYKRAEAVTIMQDQFDVRERSLSTYSSQIAKLDVAYAAGEISQAAYVEGLNEVSNGLYDNLEAMNDLDNQMMHYYGDTLVAAQEEIAKTTTQLEKQTAILDHYMNLIDLMGKSTDYKKVGIVLEGQAQTTKNEMIAAREEYETFSKEKDEMYLLWQTAATEEAAELYKQQYEDALAASDAAQEAYLSKAEAYGEALRAILENNLSQYAQDLENAFTGGTSFDELTTKMERMSSLQEEYLTTTNKIYETNKLMNQAQQEIDKSTSSVAKQKLKSFITETEQLQKKNKLSQFELQIQQAKYDLLLAEIALEEAQEAKSQVRLQRDSEGNFGYVYTADQNQVSEAQQQVLDAENNLYNISLEGANDYAEKYVQTINELYDTLTDIQQRYLDGAFESEEEYHRAMEDAKAYYYAMLEDYSDLYTIAISTDARVLEDSWSKEFGSMTYNTEKWKDDVVDYVDDVVSAFKQWDTEMDTLASEVGIGGDLSNLASSVNEITKESESLVDTLTKPGGVLDTIQAEIDAVGDLTQVYANQRTEIQKNIEKYEELIDVINEKKRLEANREDPNNVTDSAKDTKSNQSSDKNTNGSGSGNKSGIGDSKYVSVKDGALIYDYKGDTSGESRYFKTGKYEVLEKKDGWVKVHHEDANKGITGWFKESDLVGLASGGYTGEWGPYGKLAMLHEKELVLNKEDTSNLLDSMKLLDNIIQTIDLYTTNSQMRGILNSPAFGNIGSEILEQQVTIEANFPNVSSRTEIEEAFSTLINRASQYANRK